MKETNNSLPKSKLFQGLKIPPYVVVTNEDASTTYGGQDYKIGFAADFIEENEVDIDKNISVGYKGKLQMIHLGGIII